MRRCGMRSVHGARMRNEAVRKRHADCRARGSLCVRGGGHRDDYAAPGQSAAVAQEAEQIGTKCRCQPCPPRTSAVDDARSSGAAQSSPHGPPRVLLAEDNPANREYAALVLQRLGLEVDCVSDGESALEALGGNDYALVLMDVLMPGMGGLQTTRAIRDTSSPVRDPSIPIVALTADDTLGDRARCLDAGMNGYLPKPVRPAEMADIIAHWLGEGRPACAAAAPESGPAPAGPDGDTMWPPRDLLDVYLATLPDHISRLRRATALRDEQAIRAEAHSLEGASALVQADGIQHACRAVGAAARGAEWELIAGALAELEQRCDALLLSREGETQLVLG